MSPKFSLCRDALRYALRLFFSLLFWSVLVRMCMLCGVVLGRRAESFFGVRDRERERARDRVNLTLVSRRKPATERGLTTTQTAEIYAH